MIHTNKTFNEFLNDAKSRITEIDIEGADKLISQGYNVLDIREPHEHEASHIEGSINIPRGVLEPAADLTFEGANPDLRDARDSQWLVVCATGGRAALATDTLQQMGFKNMVNLAGGMNAWESAGKKVLVSEPIY